MPDFSIADDPWGYDPSGLRERLRRRAAAKRVGLGKADVGDYIDTALSVPGRLAEGLVNSAISGVTLPGDVATGKVDIGSPEGREEAIARSLDTAGLGAVGGVTAEPGAVTAGLGRGWYSPVAKAVESGPVKAPVEQWLNTLRNKPGVKPEELDWLDLKGKLSTHTGPVGRDIVARHVEEGLPEIKEVVKGGVTEDHYISIDDDGFYVVKDENGHQIGGFSTRLDAEDYLDSLGSPTKFSQYQLPGGENYREVLLTLPGKDATVPFSYADGERLRQLIKMQEDGRNLSPDEIKEYNDLDRRALARDAEKDKADFVSSHWDEPNVLVHMRLNDRDIGGRKTLFAEEIQSDWHQQGRKKGYGPSTGPRGWGDTAGGTAGGVPDAPFKKTWPDLALKRIVREAAEKGYDQVAWTDGATQADRYDLSKHLDYVRAQQRSDGTYFLAGGKNGTELFAKRSLTKDQLADHVGKELAEKIIKNKGGEYTGLDLKVGGEGMKGFYDRILPAQANKLFGKYGSKVTEAPLGASVAGGKEGAQVHLLPITPELRRAATTEGFSLFSGGKGAVVPAALTTSPTFRRWFGESRVVGEDGAPKVMYHGTNHDIPAFDKNKIRAVDYDAPFNGFWFTSSPNASPAMRDPYAVMPVFLSIRNPAPFTVWRKIAKDVASDNHLRNGTRSTNDEVRLRLQDMGYDGVQWSGKPKIDEEKLARDGQVTFQNPHRGGWYTLKREPDGSLDLYDGKEVLQNKGNHVTGGFSDIQDFLNTLYNEEEWVAFEPPQIKSIANRGLFNPNSSDILAARGIPILHSPPDPRLEDDPDKVRDPGNYQENNDRGATNDTPTDPQRLPRNPHYDMTVPYFMNHPRMTKTGRV